MRWARPAPISAAPPNPPPALRGDPTCPTPRRRGVPCTPGPRHAVGAACSDLGCAPEPPAGASRGPHLPHAAPARRAVHAGAAPCGGRGLLRSRLRPRTPRRRFAGTPPAPRRAGAACRARRGRAMRWARPAPISAAPPNPPPASSARGVAPHPRSALAGAPRPAPGAAGHAVHGLTQCPLAPRRAGAACRARRGRAMRWARPAPISAAPPNPPPASSARGVAPHPRSALAGAPRPAPGAAGHAVHGLTQCPLAPRRAGAASRPTHGQRFSETVR